MKKVLSRAWLPIFLILLALFFDLTLVLSSHSVEAAIGAACQDRLDGRSSTLSDGTCAAVGTCSGTAGGRTTCGDGEICCIAAGGMACTGDNTGRAGTCLTTSQCDPSNTDSSASCPSGRICCAPAESGATGLRTCVGDNNGLSGVCKPSGECAAADRDSAVGYCTGGLVCCTSAASTDGPGGGPNVNGACAQGTCRQNGCLANLSESGAGACNANRGTCCVRSTASIGGSGTAITFTNPLKFNTVEGVLNNLLSTLQKIIVVLALIFLVVGAILYIISGGNEQRMETGKKAILAAMIGLALGLAAPAFLKEIGEVLGWGEVESSAVAGAKTLTEILRNVLMFLLSIVGILALIMLVIGGLMYLLAAGDEDRIDTGKNIVKYSIIGIVIAFGAMIIVQQIANFFL